MFNIHITAEGKEMLICEMEDSHLLNTVALYLNRLNAILKALNTKESMDHYQQILYNHRNVSPEEAAAMTKDVSKNIAPYVTELALRGLAEKIKPLMQKTFGRTGRVELHSRQLLLNASSSPEEIDWMLGEALNEIFPEHKAGDRAYIDTDDLHGHIPTIWEDEDPDITTKIAKKRVSN